MKLVNGDNISELKKLDDDSVDSVVTDPPYGLSFMNKKWDHSVPSVEFWREVFRVLKPGGHVLSFGGTRTYHRMAVNIEDAGFEIRDQIMWLYGSGFPKSHNISKGIDKKFGVEREVVGVNPSVRPNHGNNPNLVAQNQLKGECNITKPGHDLAKQWDGFGTALKPANEPIVLARKPLSEKTIVDNVLEHGTGGLNIDGCRVETEEKLSFGSRQLGDGIKYGKCNPTTDGIQNPQGRFPANIILDEEAGQVLDEQVEKVSRFFYCAKASKSERQGSTHPTMKPIKLMEYLVRLVTPPGGTVLDPFMGSGTTGIAAKNEGFGFVGMELDSDYFEIAKKRIENN